MLTHKDLTDLNPLDETDMYYVDFIHSGAKAYNQSIVAFVTERVDRLVEAQAKEESKRPRWQRVPTFYIY